MEIGWFRASLEEEQVAAKFVTTTAALAAIFVAAALIVNAQTSPTSERRPDAHGTGSDAVQGEKMRASKILGSAVYNARNTKIGSVRELVLDKEDGSVTAVIIEVDFVGLGDKTVAVNLDDITISNNHLTLDRTIDELQQMTSYKLERDKGGAGSSSPNSGGRLPIVPAQ
jgi:sporulation protein YlmC with PRC-barrel domain